MQRTGAHMRKRHWVATAVGLALFLGSLGVVHADNGSLRKSSGVGRVDNPLYAEECGACHFAYQPGLLPAKSWERLMNGLDDHFGDNAELAPEDRAAIAEYLAANAADRANNKRSAHIIRSLARKGIEAPLRISEVPFIRHEHNEIPRRMLRDNPRVTSIANCDACHTRAADGYYSERYIQIPGFEKWDD